LKKIRFFDFLGKAYFGPQAGKVNIMVDGDFLAAHLKIDVDYEFKIKNNI
jgi:hypothetical protein